MRNMPRSCVLPQKCYRFCPQEVGLRFTERLRFCVIFVKFNLREVWFWPVGGFPWCWAYHPLCSLSPMLSPILVTGSTGIPNYWERLRKQPKKKSTSETYCTAPVGSTGCAFCWIHQSRAIPGSSEKSSHATNRMNCPAPPCHPHFNVGTRLKPSNMNVWFFSEG